MVTIDQKLNKDLEIVNEIEKIRTGNNVNFQLHSGWHKTQGRSG